MSFTIRTAERRDVPLIVEFNRAMAWETEAQKLDVETVTAGVTAVIDDAARGFYVVADASEGIIGSLLITYEWSDWRDGVYWWIQSVYVPPPFRRRGVYRAMYQHVQALAGQALENVCGFRLYVEQGNDVAKRAYRNLGMRPSVYQMYERNRNP